MEKKIDNEAKHVVPDKLDQANNVTNPEEHVSSVEDGFDDDDGIDNLLSELEFSQSGIVKHAPKENSDPNECVILSSIIYSNKHVKRIRVVVVRIYPTLFHYLDDNGKRRILNKGRMTRVLGNRPLDDVLSKQRIFSVRGVDVAAYNLGNWSTSAVIDIPFSNEARISAIEEGDIVEFTDLIAVDCASANRLSGGRQSTITPVGKGGLVAEKIPRQLSFGCHINDSDFSPPFFEFDYVGYVLHVEPPSDSGGQHIMCIEEDGTSIVIHFPGTLHDWSLENVILKKSLVGFMNLCCRFGYINATSKTDVILEPVTGTLKDRCAKLKEGRDIVINYHFNNSPPIPSKGTTPAIKPPTSSTEEFEFVKPSKPAPRKKSSVNTNPTEESAFVKPSKPAPKTKLKILGPSIQTNSTPTEPQSPSKSPLYEPFEEKNA